MYVRRKMYRELGGYPGYMATPIRELQEVRISIIAEMQYQAAQHKEQQQKQEEMEREAERQRRLAEKVRR